MTKLEIFNLALSLLPHDRRVEDVDEESTEALRCRDMWDVSRKSVLSSREWTFLIKQTPLCQPSFNTYGIDGWPIPDDSLRVIGLVDHMGRRIRTDAVNGMLRAKTPMAAVRYMPDSEDPEDWPQYICEAVAYELASRICPVMTDNASRESALRGMAADRLTQAGKLDAMSTAYSGTDGMEYIRARR